MPKLSASKQHAWQETWAHLVKLGWRAEVSDNGIRQDTYYMPPGVTRFCGSRLRRDYFDSHKQVFKYLECNNCATTAEIVQDNANVSGVGKSLCSVPMQHASAGVADAVVDDDSAVATPDVEGSATPMVAVGAIGPEGDDCAPKPARANNERSEQDSCVVDPDMMQELIPASGQASCAASTQHASAGVADSVTGDVSAGAAPDAAGFSTPTIAASAICVEGGDCAPKLARANNECNGHSYAVPPQHASAGVADVVRSDAAASALLEAAEYSSTPGRRRGLNAQAQKHTDDTSKSATVDAVPLAEQQQAKYAGGATGAAGAVGVLGIGGAARAADRLKVTAGGLAQMNKESRGLPRRRIIGKTRVAVAVQFPPSGSAISQRAKRKMPSAAKSMHGKAFASNLTPWLGCVAAAKSALGATGFIAVGGTSEMGREVLKLARAQYESLQQAGWTPGGTTEVRARVRPPKIDRVKKPMKIKSKCGTRAMVRAGHAFQTRGGLTAESLKTNARGCIVSKRKSEKAKRTNVTPWANALKQAKFELGLKGFVLPAKGTAVHARALMHYRSQIASAARQDA